ncbi:MAG: tetratricopeptide repeat protein [Phormidium sp.]
MKDYQEKLAILNKVIAENPYDVGAIARRGEIYRLMKQYELSIADFNLAIKQNANYFWAIAHRGESYRLMKCYPEALADFNLAIELNHNYAWAFAHRGVTYRFMGKSYYENALADFNQAIQLESNYAWALAYRARIYDLLRRYEEALVDFERAIALDQTLFDDWQTERGMLYSYCGRYSEAIACCQEALQINPNNCFALYNIAVFKTRWQGLTKAQLDINIAKSALLSSLNSELLRGIALYRLGGLAAIENKTEEALNFLQEAILLTQEAIEFAPHDIAWLELRDHPRFQHLIAEHT